MSRCSPGYFKVKPGTGITNQEVAFCAYCRHPNDPNEFLTEEQKRFAEDVVSQEAQEGIDKMVEKSLSLGSSGRKQYDGRLISMELSYKPGHRAAVRKPFEEVLQRVVVCPNCGLDHAVFGLAVWCPACGEDIFMTHVTSEYSVVLSMLSDVDRRREELGPRVAARDIENCLEDTVSIYEAVLRALVIRRLKTSGMSDGEATKLVRKKGRNKFQSIKLSAEVIEELVAVPVFLDLGEDEIENLNQTFQKRNPITHNLGVIDHKYLERVLSAEREGREIQVTSGEITQTIETVISILDSLHRRLFGVCERSRELTK